MKDDCDSNSGKLHGSNIKIRRPDLLKWETHTNENFGDPTHIFQCDDCEFKSNTWAECEELTETVWCEDDKEYIEASQIRCPKCKSWFYF